MSQSSRESGSVTKNLRDVQHGDMGDAAHDLFVRFYQRVVDKARNWANRLQVADASDVAVSVWDSVLRGMPQGKYKCEDRQEFEELLGKITYHKAVNLYNWVKRPQRHPTIKLPDEEILNEFTLDEKHRKIAELYYLDGKCTDEISADLDIDNQQVEERLAHIRRWLQKHRYRVTNHAHNDFILESPADDRPIDVLLFEELILSFEDKLRDTILLKLEGFSNEEIAKKMDVTTRQIQRRLTLVRDLLKTELKSD